MEILVKARSSFTVFLSIIEENNTVIKAYVFKKLKSTYGISWTNKVIIPTSTPCFIPNLNTNRDTIAIDIQLVKFVVKKSGDHNNGLQLVFNMFFTNASNMPIFVDAFVLYL